MATSIPNPTHMLLGAFLTLSACSDPGTTTTTTITTATGTTDGPLGTTTTTTAPGTTDGLPVTTGGPTTGDTNPTGDVECFDAADADDRRAQRAAHRLGHLRV